MFPKINYDTKERIFEVLAINYHHNNDNNSIIVAAINLLEYNEYMKSSY